MTPSEMEEQIKNLNLWAEEVAQILPKLVTKDDLRDAVSKLATKDDLKAFARKDDLKAFARKEDVEASKRYTENLILVTRREIRQVDQKVDGLGRQLAAVADDVKKIAEQVAILTTRRPT